MRLQFSRFYHKDNIRILDYLAGVGSEPDLDSFCQTALVRIASLVPFENSAVFFGIKPLYVSYMREVVGVVQKEIDAFNHYYWSTGPKFETKTAIVDWNDYQNTEFVTDYMFPCNIGRTLMMVFLLPIPLPSSGCLAINRPRLSRPFSEQAQTIFEYLQPHLNNYYRIFSKMSQLTIEQIQVRELVRDCKLLSKREAEVASLLCQGLTMTEAATKLLISPRTIQTHVENIKEKLGVRNRQQMIIKLTRN